MSKYDSLTNFLLGQPPGPVTMTFTQVNTLLGFCIPAAARKYQVWWANETDQNTRHRQCHSWLNANRKASADLKHGVVIVDRGTESISFVILDQIIICTKAISRV